MRRDLPPGLGAAYATSFGLGLVLFMAQAALAMAVAGYAVLLRLRPDSFNPLWAGLTLAGMAINGYALARAVKSRHFLGLFAEWPGLPEEESAIQETRLLAVSAQQAFFHRDFDRCAQVLARLGPGSPELSLARGRALTLAGRFDEALAPLDEGGQGSAARRYLTPQRNLLFWTRRYFEPSDIHWTRNSGLLLGLGLLALGLTLPLLAQDWQLLGDALNPAEVSFSASDFQVAVTGPFTLHYHDDAFMRQTADIAGAALAQDLDFLALPPDSFGPGQIHLFLCSNQAEYLARSPYTHSWEAASALPEKREIYLYQLPPHAAIFYEETLAHELTHLCYHKVVPTDRQDSWLNEGLAEYLGYRFALERAHFPRQSWLMANHFAQLKGHALPFATFLEDNPQLMQDTRQIDVFYVQGFSIVYVLIEQYGREPFLRFLRVFATGKSLSESLALSYPTIHNADDLRSVWDLFMQ